MSLQGGGFSDRSSRGGPQEAGGSTEQCVPAPPPGPAPEPALRFRSHSTGARRRASSDEPADSRYPDCLLPLPLNVLAARSALEHWGGGATRSHYRLSGSETSAWGEGASSDLARAQVGQPTTVPIRVALHGAGSRCCSRSSRWWCGRTPT